MIECVTSRVGSRVCGLERVEQGGEGGRVVKQLVLQGRRWVQEKLEANPFASLVVLLPDW